MSIHNQLAALGHGPVGTCGPAMQEYDFEIRIYNRVAEILLEQGLATGAAVNDAYLTPAFAKNTIAVALLTDADGPSVGWAFCRAMAMDGRGMLEALTMIPRTCVCEHQPAGANMPGLSKVYF